MNVADVPKKLMRMLPPFLRRKSGETFVRRHSRHVCCVLGSMWVVERELEQAGVILEISQGGVLFRPASAFLLNRLTEVVRINFDGFHAEGVIANVRPIGYGIRFFNEIPEEQVNQVVHNYGVDALTFLSERQTH